MKRKWCAALGLLLWCTAAHAQLSQPLRIQNAGTTLALEYKLNFVNGGCVVNAGQARIDCTIGGGGSTITGLASAYNLGAVAADQTMLVQAGKGGSVIAQANGANTGDVFDVLDSSTNALLEVPDNNTIMVQGGQSNGANDYVHIGSVNNITTASAKLVAVTNQGTAVAWFKPWGGASINMGAAQTSGAPQSLLIGEIDHTGITAGTNIKDVQYVARTLQWATGAVAEADAWFIGQPTFAAVGASTFTKAATFAIAGPPAQGANATITEADALWVQSGIARFDTNAIGVGTTTVGVTIQNTTVTLVGSQQQYAPLFEQCGHGWQAGAVNADQLVCAALQQRPQPGAAVAATSRIVLANKYGGGAYADSLFIDTDTTNTTTFTASGPTQTNIMFGSSVIIHSNSGVVREDGITPNSDGQILGEPTIPVAWSVIAKNLYGRLQTPAFSNTMNIDPSLGEHVKIVLTANLTNWTISAPPAGANNTKQFVMLEFVQDATGSRTIGTPPAIIKWLPTLYRGVTHTAPTLTTTANAKDYIFLVSDNDAGTYIQVDQNLNN